MASPKSQKNELPPNVTLFGVVKGPDGWVSVQAKVDSKGNVASVKESNPDIRAAAVERSKIDFILQIAKDDGVYND